MAVIANITSFTGTADAELSASDADWVQSSTSPFGTQTLTLDGSGGLKVPTTLGNTYGYLRSETPGSANQTVQATINMGAEATDVFPLLLARVNTDNWIGCYIINSANTVHIARCVGGTRTSVANTAYTLTTDTDYDIELAVSGSAPNISVSLRIADVEVLSDSGAGFNFAALNAVGQVGIHYRASSTIPTADRLSFKSFYAEDDIAESASAPTIVNKLLRQSSSASVVAHNSRRYG